MIIKFIFSLLMLFSVSAFAISLNECNKMSAALNARTPMKIDSMTTVKSSYCSDSKPKPTLVYMMETSFSSLDINATQNIQKNGWCTDPTQRKLLNEVDVKYQYRTKVGVYLGETRINSRMCN
jgi:hypothetical protein